MRFDGGGRWSSGENVWMSLCVQCGARQGQERQETLTQVDIARQDRLANTLQNYTTRRTQAPRCRVSTSFPCCESAEEQVRGEVSRGEREMNGYRGVVQLVEGSYKGPTPVDGRGETHTVALFQHARALSYASRAPCLE
jgi:hypothetical protein